MVCRTNDAATQTQGLGHTARSRNLPLNFVSFKSPQPCVRFSLKITQMFLSMLCKSRSQFKVIGFRGVGYGCPSDCSLVIFARLLSTSKETLHCFCVTLLRTSKSHLLCFYLTFLRTSKECREECKDQE